MTFFPFFHLETLTFVKEIDSQRKLMRVTFAHDVSYLAYDVSVLVLLLEDSCIQVTQETFSEDHLVTNHYEYWSIDQPINVINVTCGEIASV